MKKREWVEHNVCRFCQARAYHSCGWVSCLPAIEVAGKYYDEHKEELEVRTDTITKSKKIRSMSDEELAKFLSEDCGVCLNIVGDYECNHNCIEHWKKWLDSGIDDIHTQQAELSNRTEIELQASRLITECRFEEAMELLNTLISSDIDG